MFPKTTKILFLILLNTCFQSFSQSIELLDSKRKWILIDNKIEKKEVILQAYDSLLVDYNTLVLRFLPKGKIEYDYESTAEACAGVDFLDIDTDLSSWAYNTDNQVFTLTLKGGYATLDGFKFKRDYQIERYGERAFILVKVKEYYFTDLEKLARKEERLEKKKNVINRIK